MVEHLVKDKTLIVIVHRLSTITVIIRTRHESRCACDEQPKKAF